MESETSQAPRAAYQNPTTLFIDIRISEYYVIVMNIAPENKATLIFKWNNRHSIFQARVTRMCRIIT